MNFGAKHNSSKKYSKSQMIEDLNPEKLQNHSIVNMILNESLDAINWYDNRGNVGDNVPIETLEQFHASILNRKAQTTIECGHTILETQMHPTAEDIVKAPVKQMIYNLCGKRAYRYEIEE